MPIVSQLPQGKVSNVSRQTSKQVLETVRALQLSLVENAEDFLHGESLPQDIREAFLETPRHAFAPRFQDGSPGLWSDVQDDVLLQHLNTLYADQPYCIFKDGAGETISTISQPSLVIYMLYLLDLRPGLRVFELGGGSGWNAALMSRLVGEQGHVTSIEILPSLDANAQKALSELGIKNVSLISGDAYSLIADQEPFDRGVFTASAWELPSFFFEKIKDGGLLLFVLKFTPTTDLLILLRKKGDHFASETQLPCRFVPITRETPPDSQQIVSTEETRFFQEFDSREIDFQDLQLKIFPDRGFTETGPNDFAFNRGDSRFIWSFPG